MADPTSRYASIGFATYTAADGREVVHLRPRPLPPAPAAAVEYVVAEGERLDVIAARQLGDPLAYWQICDANEAMNPFDMVRAGAPLRLAAGEEP